MTSVPFYQLDAFTNSPFKGNPAAVCLLASFPSDGILQTIASENNLSETAFLVPREAAGHYDLRWFTPAVEVDLCGHATLAAGAALFRHHEVDLDTLTFHTKSGTFPFHRDGDKYSFDFPKLMAEPAYVPAMKTAFGIKPQTVLKKDRDYLLVFETQDDIESLVPDLKTLMREVDHGFVCTAPGRAADVDFVSRCFYPNHGIDEDPVTGSAHSLSAPYWAGVLGKNTLYARQISARSGDLWIKVFDDKIILTGQAIEIIAGTMTL